MEPWGTPELLKLFNYTFSFRVQPNTRLPLPLRPSLPPSTPPPPTRTRQLSSSSSRAAR